MECNIKHCFFDHYILDIVGPPHDPLTREIVGRMEKEIPSKVIETSADQGQQAVDSHDHDFTLAISKRLAEFKEKEKQLAVERDAIDQKIKDSQHEFDEMKRDVEVLNQLNPSQYQQLEQEMQE